ncbi:MAG: hypothetical protein FWE16_05260 [Firmicutes bacterium]|nr:hypothetical protein [Bacillota bacterium]
MKLTEEQRKAEINKIRRIRAKENAQIETEILELPKKKISAELRKAELNALVKKRAKNNAEAKAKLMALGVKYAQRTPPPRPTPCNCEQISCDCGSAGGITEQAHEMLEHMESVVNFQGTPYNTKPPKDLTLTSAGMPDETEISKVRCEVAEVSGAMHMLAQFLASQNVKVINPQPYINKLAHIESVACCQARVPYNAVPHQYVQTMPQVLMTPTGQVDTSEIDKVKTEVLEVKDAVNSLAKSFDSYNLGKMHGAIESLRGNHQPVIYPQQQIQPQAQPIIVQAQPQQQSQPNGGQPVIVNNTVPGFTQPQPHQVPPAHHMPPEQQQQGSSGLAEMLAQMGKKLDGLATEMKE